MATGLNRVLRGARRQTRAWVRDCVEAHGKRNDTTIERTCPADSTTCVLACRHSMLYNITRVGSIFVEGTSAGALECSDGHHYSLDEIDRQLEQCADALVDRLDQLQARGWSACAIDHVHRDGLSQREIAERFGWPSRQRVQQIENTALAKLRSSGLDINDVKSEPPAWRHNARTAQRAA